MDGDEFNQLLNQARDGETAAVLGAVDLDPSLLRRADQDGWRLLNFACLEGHIELVRCLLERGADPLALDEHEADALSIVAWNDNVELAALLLDFGADPNAGNEEEGPLLSVAARWARPELCRLLIARGADLMREHRGLTALAEYGHRMHLDERDKDVARAELLDAWHNGPHPLQVLRRLRDDNWARRWPMMQVVVCCGYRPLAAVRLALELERAASIDPAAQLAPVVIDTPEKRRAFRLSLVLANDGLARRIASFI